MVFCQFLQRIVAQYVTGDKLLTISKHWYAREVVIRVAVVVCLQGHTLLGDGSYHAGCHHLVGFHFVQTHQVTDDLILLFLYHAFFFADVGHGYHLFAAHCGLVLLREDFGDEFDEFHDGVHDKDEHAYHVCCWAHQLFPEGGTDGFGEDLREHQDEYGHDGAAYAEPCFAKDQGGLHTYAAGTYGVGDGVQRKDSGQWTLGLGLIFLHQLCGFVSFFFAQVDIGECRRHEGGL